MVSFINEVYNLISSSFQFSSEYEIILYTQPNRTYNTSHVVRSFIFVINLA
jgi:hypothetical protein